MTQRPLSALVTFGTLVLAFLGAATTGILRLLAWVVPSLTPGLLPEGLVKAMSGLNRHERGLLTILHPVLGGLLLACGITYAVLWRRGTAPPLPRVWGESATTAFFRWVVGLFHPRRLERLHLRDALIMPSVEFAIALGAAIVTAPLIVLPLGPVSQAAIALHRINGIYVASLGFYALVVLAFRRRGPSPWPTTIRDGRVVRGGRIVSIATDV